MRNLILGLILSLIASSSADAALTLTTDHRSLFFGPMKLGETKELAQSGAYHNQISCSSSNGNQWYLKVNIIQPLMSGADQIPPENFRWAVVWATGKGTIPASRGTYKPFSIFPELVYMSGPGEAAGQAVDLQFKYSLEIPETQVSGVYNAIIRFTLTEIQ
jgi:hypothetical protein